MSDIHTGCKAAWESEKRRADFLDARMMGLQTRLNQLATRLDGIDSTTTYQSLKNKTMGGAVRFLLTELPPEDIPPEATP